MTRGRTPRTEVQSWVASMGVVYEFDLVTGVAA